MYLPHTHTCSPHTLHTHTHAHTLHTYTRTAHHTTHMHTTHTTHTCTPHTHYSHAHHTHTLHTHAHYTHMHTTHTHYTHTHAYHTPSTYTVRVQYALCTHKRVHCAKPTYMYSTPVHILIHHHFMCIHACTSHTACCTIQSPYTMHVYTHTHSIAGACTAHCTHTCRCAHYTYAHISYSIFPGSWTLTYTLCDC